MARSASVQGPLPAQSQLGTQERLDSKEILYERLLAVKSKAGVEFLRLEDDLRRAVDTFEAVGEYYQKTNKISLAFTFWSFSRYFEILKLTLRESFSLSPNDALDFIASIRAYFSHAHGLDNIFAIQEGISTIANAFFRATFTLEPSLVDFIIRHVAEKEETWALSDVEFEDSMNLSDERFQWLEQHERFRKTFLGEYINQLYNVTMEPAADFPAAAKKLSDRELKECVQKGKVAAAILAERETTSRVTEELRPDTTAPDTVEPPDGKSEAAEAADEATSRKRLEWIKAQAEGETPPEFVLRVFKTELADSQMHTGLLNQYEKLYQDFFNWKRTHALPPELQNLPKKGEWIRNQVHEGKIVARRGDDQRRYERDVKRVAAAKPV